MSVKKHLFCRNGHFYYRTKIPTDLLHLFPSKELKKSLKTTDPKSAATIAASLRFRIQKVFTLLRTGMLSEEQIAEMVKELAARKSPDAQKITDLSEIIHQYTLEHHKNWGPKTSLEMQGSFKLIQDIVGDIKLSAVTKQTIVDLRSNLACLPANMYKIYPGKTIKQILGMSDIVPMSTTSVNKQISRFSSILKYAIKEGHMTVNYAERMKIRQNRRSDEERKAYSTDDLQRIVDNLPQKAERRERYWIPLIAMHSGLRLDEICQLYIEDVMEFDGVWCFSINDEKDKKLKTASSKRIIPVHPTLLNLGLLDHICKVKENNKPRLWMNLQWRKADGYSNAFGKWFQRFNRSYVTNDADKVFHSLRHALANNLKQQGITEVVISEILGHSHDSITMSRYGKRYQPQVLLDAMIKLDYGIDVQRAKW